MGNKIVEALAALTTTTQEVCPDLLVINFTVVTACLIGRPGGEFLLFDTGLANSADFIKRTVAERFGEGARPAAIILSHGHFDHVGAVIRLSQDWDVPVYIHELELPYVTGRRDYPLADPTVSTGLVAQLSPTFPHTAIDLGDRVSALPGDGTMPGIAGWRWIHTPGHTEGHVSLFRESDRTLLAADAILTVKQESLWSVITQAERISGPPQYLTVDWEAAERSVALLRDLQPELLIPGHGRPLAGDELERELSKLVCNFEAIARPEQGRFVEQP